MSDASTTSAVRVRFAPSPTGTLHVGSARAALFNWLYARHHGGTFVVRIDDTDADRSERQHEEDILDDLRWLGLTWDEGPGEGGPYGPYRQSERLEQYRAAAETLVASGHAYVCFCSEERLEGLRAATLASGGTPRYDRHCLTLSEGEVERRLAAGEPFVLRFRMPEEPTVIHDVTRGAVAVGAHAIGDFILVRSDGVASYNFATVVDDLAMRITHVIRGDDHLTNTARQIRLAEALGADPPRFAHHSMVLGPDGAKLSKRHGATSVGDFRRLGYLPSALVNYLALLSWSHGGDEVLSLRRLVEEFALERLSPSPSTFDQAKLDWLGHEHIMALPRAEHERLFAERLAPGTPPESAAALAAAFQPSLVAYGQAPALAAEVLAVPEPDLGRLADAGSQLLEARRLRAAAPEWLSFEAAHELLAAYRSWGKQHGIGARGVLMPLRLALTGREHGPELPYVLAALPRAEALGRLDAALTAGSSDLSTTI